MNLKTNFISNEECAKIHELTLRVLWEMGVEFNDEYALARFEEAGATVEGTIVKIPEALVKKALATAPASFVLHGRNGKSITIGGDNQIIAPESGALNVLDQEGLHQNTAQDYKNFQKLHHNSPVMDILNPSLIEPGDIERAVVRDYQMAVCLKYTDKPLLGLATSKQDALHSIDMTQRFYGETDSVLLGIISVISPCKYDNEMLQSMRVFVEKNQPVMVAACSQPGATSPVSSFGTIVLDNAQILAGVIYSQILKPGIGVMYGNTTGSCDLRFVSPAIGAPETSFSIFAAAAMCQYYNLPCRTGGSLSDAKTVDWQAGVESAVTLLPSIMSSSNFLLHSCGVMDSFNVLSYAKYILDEQNVAMCRFMTAGVDILLDEERTQEEIDNIIEAGPGGQYLESDHTMDYFREERFTPLFFNKMGYSSYLHNGTPSIESYAFKEVNRRLEAYQYPDMSQAQEDVLREYIGDLVDTI